MAEKTPNLEAVTRMVADKIALAHAMFDGTGRAPFIEFGFSDAEDIRAALERAERVEAAADKLSIAIAIYQQSGRWNPVEDAVEAVRAALAPAPEGSQKFPEIVGDWNSAEDAAYDAPAPGEEGK